MKHFTRRLSLFFLLTSLFISTALHSAARQDLNCSDVEIEETFIVDILSDETQVEEYLTYIVQQIPQTRRCELNYNAARGILGEVTAVSFFTWRGVLDSCAPPRDAYKYESFEDMVTEQGCEFSSKNRGDQGIDTIFFPLQVRGGRREINTERRIVINESKYSGQGTLKLSKTKTKCDQMTREWITANIDILDRAITEEADECVLTFGNKTCMVKGCYEYVRKLLVHISNELEHKRVIRTATVLDDQGTLAVNVIKDKPRRGARRYSAAGTGLATIRTTVEAQSTLTSEGFDAMVAEAIKAYNMTHTQKRNCPARSKSSGIRRQGKQRRG